MVTFPPAEDDVLHGTVNLLTDNQLDPVVSCVFQKKTDDPYTERERERVDFRIMNHRPLDDNKRTLRLKANPHFSLLLWYSGICYITWLTA